MKHVFVTLAIVGGLALPSDGEAQIFGGVFGAWAVDSFDGAVGVGGQLGLNIPVLPLDVYGSGTWFLPDCEGCKLKGWSLGVTFRPLPLPLARPYLVGGLASRSMDDPGNDVALDSSGAFAGLGLDVALVGFRVFAEGRYEFLEGDLKQPVLRVGALF